MKGAGYNTHGKPRFSAQQMCKYNEDLVASAARANSITQREQQKGPRATMRDLYAKLKTEEEKRKENIEKFNEYANKLVNIGYKKENILSWIEDLIEPEDKDKIFETLEADKCNEEKANYGNDR